jgi:hypothetical protein
VDAVLLGARRRATHRTADVAVVGGRAG